MEMTLLKLLLSVAVLGPGTSAGLNVMSPVDILMPVTAQAEAVSSSVKRKPDYSKVNFKTRIFSFIDLHFLLWILFCRV